MKMRHPATGAVLLMLATASFGGGIVRGGGKDIPAVTLSGTSMPVSPKLAVELGAKVLDPVTPTAGLAGSPALTPEVKAEAAELHAKSIIIDEPAAAKDHGVRFADQLQGALAKGLFDAGAYFDLSGKAKVSPELGDGVAPGASAAETRLTQLRQNTSEFKSAATSGAKIYYMTRGGYPVPMKGDVRSFLESGQLALYRLKSSGRDPLYVATPGRSSPLKAYEEEADSLAMEVVVAGAKVAKALDRLESAIHNNADDIILAAWKEAKVSLSGFVTARNAWKLKRDALYAKANAGDRAFLKAVMDGADLKKSVSALDVGTLLQGRFPNADALLEARYPEEIGELRRLIPNLSRVGIAGFENSIFLSRDLTRALVANRRSREKEEPAGVFVLSEVRFQIAPEDIPELLDRLEKIDAGSLRAFAPELRALTDEALPALAKYNEALDAMERNIQKARSGKAVIAAVSVANATMQEFRTDAARWKTRRDALLGKASDPAVRSFLDATLAALDLNRSQLSLENILVQRFPNADKLLAALYPEHIAALRRYIPQLASISVGGFESSFFVDKGSVDEFVAALEHVALMGKKPEVAGATALSNIPFLVATEDETPQAVVRSGSYLLPYRVPGVRDVVDTEDSRTDAAYLWPDTQPNQRKDGLRQRFKVFDALIESNFRVLPLMNHVRGMTKSGAKVIVAEMGKMVSSYQELTTLAGNAADGEAVAEKYNSIVASLEAAWIDLPEGQPLPQDLAARVGSFEKNVALPEIRHLHSLVNYMHKKSLALLAQKDQSRGTGRLSFGGHQIAFTNLQESPLIRQGRLQSPPLRALLSRLADIQSAHDDRIIINGDEAWCHATLGKHSAEIYVKFAPPDDGGMLRIRYEDWETGRGKRERMSLLEMQLADMGISHDLEAGQFLTAVLDKDHGLSSESQLAELFPSVIQTLHENSELNLYLEKFKGEKGLETIRRYADLFMAEGGWPSKYWNRNDNATFGNYYDAYVEKQQQAQRNFLRQALDVELERLALPTIPETAGFGRAVIKRYFTEAVQKALMTGQVSRGEDGIPKPQKYRPVEQLADFVLADAAEARRLASLASHLDVELPYEPIGAVGALRAERAVLRLGRKGLVLYVLRDPETGFIGYARAQAYDNELSGDLTAAALGEFLARHGLQVPAVEDVGAAQDALLDQMLRARPTSSPYRGRRAAGLAASAGQGGFVTARATFDRAGKPGAVLFVPFTEPDDINAIGQSAAVVTMGGGLLSHAGITTREMGIPSVILPTARWRKDSERRDYVELDVYTPNGKPVERKGLSLTPELTLRRLNVKEGGLIRVNGATGELSHFADNEADAAAALDYVDETLRGKPVPPPATAAAVAVALEETLFNPGARRDPDARILASLLRQEDAPLRLEARNHGRRLLMDLLRRMKDGRVELDAAELPRLEAVAKLLGIKDSAFDRFRARAAVPKLPPAEVLHALARAVRTLAHHAIVPEVLPLGAVGEGDTSIVGGKFAKLGEILAVVRSLGAYVPAALSVTTQGWQTFLEENGLKEKLRALAEELDRAQSEAATPEERQHRAAALSDKIRALIRSGKLNPQSGLGAAIWKGMRDHGLIDGQNRLAVRSSAVQEDQADAAFAGAAETYLHVKVEEALGKVIENWASFWLPRGIAYRRAHGIPSTELLPSTFIQEMAQADAAGVLFTRNPVSGADEIVINAAYGLGEGVVSGIVQTDRYNARKSDGEETRLPFLGDKRIAVMPRADGAGTEIRGIERSRRRRRALTLDQTRKLSLIAKALEAHFGFPLDIEFAIQGDRIAILQARPITTRAAKPSGPVKEKGGLAANAAAPARDLGSVLDAARPEDFHTRALAHWRRDYKPAYVMATLKALESGDRARLDSGDKAALKALRKEGSRLEGVFEMFDESHHAPGEFGSFLGMLGDLNDALDDGKDEDASRKAKSLRSWLEGRSFDARVGEFKPDDRRSTYERLARTADGVRSSLKREKFSDHEFHHVRLQMKNYVFLLHLLSDMRHDDSVLRALSSELTSLNSEMGSLRDKKRQQGDDGYDFPMPPEFRKRILAFLDSFLPASAKTTP